MAWTTLESAEREIRNYVARLESFDFVSALHEEYHGNPATEGKVRQVNSAFSQGRMYFESGSRAEMGVRPLLLYYGAMALAAGLVVFKSKGEEACNLRPSHGLKPDDWAKCMQRGLGGILDLRVSVLPGTFQAFARTVWHWHAVTVGINGRTRPELMDLGSVGMADGKSGVTLGDLLSRSRYTGGGFGEVAGAPDRLHRGHIYLNGGDFLFRPSDEIISGMGWEAIGERFGVEVPRFPWGDPNVPVFHCIAQGRPDVMPEMCVVEPFPNGDRLSELVKLYLVSYILGMLARYFPAQWMGLLRNEPGGGAQPLLARATEAIETDFMREFAQQIAVLTDDRQFFGNGFAAVSARGALQFAWRHSRDGLRDLRRHLDDDGRDRD